MLMELSEVANNYIRAACCKDHYDYSVKNAPEFGGHVGGKQWIEGLDILSMEEPTEHPCADGCDSC